VNFAFTCILVLDEV